MNIGTLIATIGGDVTPLKGALGQANAALNKFSDQAEKNAKALKQQFRGLSTVGNSMKDLGGKMTLGLTVPLVAAAGASFKMASDLDENINKTMVAFRGSGDEVVTWSKTTLKSFGIAQSSALDMASLFGDMSTSMGLTGPEAAKMSTSLVGLAGDLASFKNINTEMASGALKGIFTGETEALKGLGIVMTEENLKAFAMSQGIKENVKDMTQAEKVNLRYAYVMANTTNAQGDFARTGGGAANQMRIFGESLKEIGSQFGAIILPAVTSMITKINALMTWISGLTESQKKWVIGIGTVVAAIGPLTFGLGFLIANIIPKLVTGFKAVGTALKFAAANPWILIIAGAIALATLIVSLWKNCETFRAVVKYVALSVSAFFQKAWIEIKMGAELMWLGIKTYFTAIPKLATAVWNIIKRVMKGEAIGDVIKDEFSKIFEGIKDEASGIKEKYNEELAAIKTPDYKEILAKEKAVSAAKETGEAVGSQLNESIVTTSTGTEGTGTSKAAPMEKMKQNTVTPLVSMYQSKDIFEKTAAPIGLGKVANAYTILDKSIKDVDRSFKAAKDTAELFGQPFDENATRAEILKQKIDALTNEGLTANAAAIESLGAEYRALVTEIKATEQASINIGQMMANSIQSGAELIGTSIGNIIGNRKELNRMKEEQAGIGQQISDMMAKGLTSEDDAVKKLQESYKQLGEAINTAQDTSSLEGMLKGLLGVVLDFGAEFGKALIAVGIGKLALDNIFTAGPAGAFAAIGAGVALMALVSFAKSKLSGGINGSSGDEPTAGKLSSSPAFASGGIVPGSSYSGDNVMARVNSGEMVLNQGQQRNLFNALDSGGQTNIPSLIRLYVAGEDLEAIINTRQKRNNNLR